jgi:hypothetical protein
LHKHFFYNSKSQTHFFVFREKEKDVRCGQQEEEIRTAKNSSPNTLFGERECSGRPIQRLSIEENRRGVHQRRTLRGLHPQRRDQ